MFFDLFEMMIEKMSQVQESITTIKCRQNYASKQISSLKKKVNKNDKLFKDQVDDDVDEMSETTSQLIQIAMKHEENFRTLNKTVTNLKVQAMKGCVIVKGIIEKEEEDPIELVSSFLSETMQIETEIPIMLAHRTGKGKNKPMWFKRTDPDDSQLIYGHIRNLKEKKNAQEQNFFVSQQLTEEERERRKEGNKT